MIPQATALFERVGAELQRLRASGPSPSRVVGTQVKADADRIAHRLLVDGLSSLGPSLPVVSEEDVQHPRPPTEPYWLVDPLDGTASFVQGYSGFVTQAALMEHGRPVAAIVHAPALGRTYVAQRGKGATLNGARLSPRDAKASARTLTDNTPQPHGLAAKLFADWPLERYLESGSLGLKMCRVAQGEADLFVKDVPTRTWDIAPAHLILDEVHAAASQLDGAPISYATAAPIATLAVAHNPRDLERLQEWYAKERRTRTP